MASTVEELSIHYEENDVVIVKELDKVVLSKGAWATLLFRYQQWDPRKEEYSADKFTIRRYKKAYNEYRQQSKFNISSIEQAKKIIEALNGWIEE